MDKVLFIIVDPYDTILETVLEQEDIKSTTNTLALRVSHQLMFNGANEVKVRYVYNEHHLQTHILKHSVAVDDAYITFDKYVTDKCKTLVTSMYRTRDLEISRITIQGDIEESGASFIRLNDEEFERLKKLGDMRFRF